MLFFKKKKKRLEFVCTLKFQIFHVVFKWEYIITRPFLSI